MGNCELGCRAKATKKLWRFHKGNEMREFHVCAHHFHVEVALLGKNNPNGFFYSNGETHIFVKNEGLA